MSIEYGHFFVFFVLYHVHREFLVDLVVCCIYTHIRQYFFTDNEILKIVQSSVSLVLRERNPPVFGEFASQRASNEESVSISSLEQKCLHLNEIFITGYTGSCHFNNLQCSQWWQFHQNEDIFVSVMTSSFIHAHYSDVIMGEKASQITSLTIVYSTVYSGEDQRKHQGPASLAFVQGIHRWPVNSPTKGQ